MRWKLIAFDLDGTLLDPRKNLPEENLRAMAAAAEAGSVLVPATGRIFKGIPEQMKALPFLRYYILSNGAAVYDSREDRILFRAEIPLELALRLYAYLDTLPVIYDCYQDDMGYMSRHMLRRAPEYLVNEPEILNLVYWLRQPVDDLQEMLRQRGRPLQKLQMYFLPGDMELRQRQLLEIPRRFPGLRATSSVSCNIEVNSPEAGKGRALAALCGHLKLPLADAVAFGDGLNDADMLRAAGLGVAMENADEAVKAAADRITRSNADSGVGYMIRQLLEEDEQ